MKRIGMLTSGGDCQALNATMRGVVKGLHGCFKEVEIYGFLEGYKGLIYGNYQKLSPDDFSGILTKGGTILGSSRTPFKELDIPTPDGLDKVKSMKENYKKLKLDCLVVLGGNGSQKTANRLSEEGLNVIGLPKTIDNDLWGTDMTFGFQSAVDIATNAIDCIHTTASSHGRVFIVEVMGHKVGWITLHAGIASGADVILIPEIPYDIKKVCAALEKRTKEGKGFSILAVAEGAISKEVAKLPKKERKQAVADAAAKYPSVAYEVADKIKQYSGMDIRVTVPGHTQRGGSPCPYDRVISSRFGAKAAELIKKEDFGKLVVMKNNDVTAIPLSESAGKLKYVSPDDSIVKNAKMLGISFGD
ncbi:MAG: 6-phosphofructokinase [Lachnospiraceae bacterium]|nr:6-phosphofructokinase [Lachnospiraceae bacterium]